MNHLQSTVSWESLENKEISAHLKIIARISLPKSHDTAHRAIGSLFLIADARANTILNIPHVTSAVLMIQ